VRHHSNCTGPGCQWRASPPRRARSSAPASHHPVGPIGQGTLLLCSSPSSSRRGQGRPWPLGVGEARRGAEAGPRSFNVGPAKGRAARTLSSGQGGSGLSGRWPWRPAATRPRRRSRGGLQIGAPGVAAARGSAAAARRRWEGPGSGGFQRRPRRTGGEWRLRRPNWEVQGVAGSEGRWGRLLGVLGRPG
jgi:hypothetical protein